MNNHFGEIAALITTVFWTITALSFESASKRIGSLNLNLFRLALAILLLSSFNWIRRGAFFPYDASDHQWLWLSLSGIVGFVIGDYCLFQAFILIGARVSMLLMTLAPPIAALAGYLIMNDPVSPRGILGMIVTLSGIAMVIFVRMPVDNTTKLSISRVRLAHPLRGIIFAIIAAAGQGVGLVLSKYGMDQYDPFSSSQIRVMAGFVGFALVFTAFRKWKGARVVFQDRKAMLWLSVGSVFGPFLGVSFSLIAVQHTNAGIAQTIMSLVPVFIIAPSILITGVRPKPKEIIGALIAVTGVSLFFI